MPARTRFSYLALVGALASAGCRSESEAPPPRPPPGTLADYVDRLLPEAPTGAVAHLVGSALSAERLQRDAAPTSTVAEAWIERAWADAVRSGDPRAARAVGAGLAYRGRPVPESGTEPARAAARIGHLLARADLGAGSGALEAGLGAVADAPGSDEVRRAVLAALLTERRWRAAQEWVEGPGFESEDGRDEARLFVARGLARAGRETAARRQRARIRSAPLRDRVEAAIALAEDHAGHHRRASKLARRIESKLIRVETMARLAGRAHRRGRMRQARALLRAASTEAERIDDPLLASDAFGAIRAVEDRAGLEVSIRLADLQPRARVQVAAAAIQRDLKRGRVDAAREKLDALDAPSHLTIELTVELAVAEARRGRIDAALARVAAMAVPEARWAATGQLIALAGATPFSPERGESLRHALRPSF